MTGRHRRLMTGRHRGLMTGRHRVAVVIAIVCCYCCVSNGNGGLKLRMVRLKLYDCDQSRNTVGLKVTAEGPLLGGGM